MVSQQRPPELSRYLLTAASLCIVIAGLKIGRPLLVPLLVSAFLSILVAPAVTWLNRRRLPPVLSIALVMLASIVVILSFAGFMVGRVNQFIEQSPRYQERLSTAIAAVASWLDARGTLISQSRITDAIQPGTLLGLVKTGLSGLTETLSSTLLVLFTMVLILLESTGFPAKIRAAWGKPNVDLEQFEKILSEVKHYVLIKTYVSLLTGILVTMLLVVLGVDFPLLWGLIAFLFNYVPNIGSMIAAVPPIILSLVQLDVTSALIVAGGFIAINTAIGNGLEPQWMGKTLGLSPLVVFLSLVVWGWIWGPIGMLLSVPLTMVMKILLEHSESGRWVAVLLATAPPADSSSDGGK